MKQRIRLDTLSLEQRTELERKYVHYVPDKGHVIYSKVCKLDHYVETLPVVNGWHLIFPGGYPYIISHSTISFISQPNGLEAWNHHEGENLKFLETCYSNRALGARGYYLTAEDYETLSDWIKSTAGMCHVFLGSKRRRDIYYEIATAFGTDEVHYTRVADTAGGSYQTIYTFRPAVMLSSYMYLIIDDEHDGSTPEKGMLLEPYEEYDPSDFPLYSNGEDELTNDQYFELVDALKAFVKSPLYAKLKPILEALEKE